jgi:tetratricopeptide (TPR) repeat protein
MLEKAEPRNFGKHRAYLLAYCAVMSVAQIAAAAQVPGVPSTGPSVTIMPGVSHLISGHVKTDMATAEKLLSQGKWTEAEGLFRETLVNSPQDIPATLGLGLALANEFKLDAADSLFDRVISLDPNNSSAYAGKATVALNRLQSSAGGVRDERDSILKQALVYGNRACTLGPANAQAHFVVGLVLKEQGQIEQSVNELNSAINFDPDLSYAYSALGSIKLDQNSLAEATANFKRSISLNSSNSSAHYGLGATMLKQGDANGAIGELNTSLYQFPNSWPVRMALGQAYQQQGNTVAALQQYQLSTLIKPENAAPYLAMAQIHQERGDLELAIADLRSGLTQSPYDVNLRVKIAELNMQLDRPDEAVKNYRTVLEMSPNDNSAIKGLSQALFLKSQKETVGAMLQSNDYETASKALDEAIRLNPVDMELRLAKEKLLSLSGATAPALSPPPPLNDGDRIEYAKALISAGEFKGAFDTLQVVINDQTDAKQLYAVGDMALMIHALDSSLAAYRKGLSLGGSPERAERGLKQVAKQQQIASDSLKVANELAKKKQWDGAILKYREVLSAQPASADARYGLAEALEEGPKDSFETLTESAKQYQYYLSLASDLDTKEKEKVADLIQKLQNKADKLKQKEDKDRM